MPFLKTLGKIASGLAKMTVDGMEQEARNRSKNKKFSDSARQNFESFADGIKNTKEEYYTLKNDIKTKMNNDNISTYNDEFDCSDNQIHQSSEGSDKIENIDSEIILNRNSSINEEIRKIIKDTLPLIASRQFDCHIAPYIPSAIFNTAKFSFVHDLNLEDVIALYAIGITRNGKDAYIFTEYKMIFRDRIAGRNDIILYKDFDSYYEDTYGKYHIVLRDGTDYKLWDSRIEPAGLCKLLNDISRIINT
jgi:hypothetical protein